MNIYPGLIWLFISATACIHAGICVCVSVCVCVCLCVCEHVWVQVYEQLSVLQFKNLLINHKENNINKQSC